MESIGYIVKDYMYESLKAWPDRALDKQKRVSAYVTMSVVTRTYRQLVGLQCS